MKKKYKKRMLGILGIIFSIFLMFGLVQIWKMDWFYTIADAQSEMTGNVAIDEEIVDSMGEANFTVMLFFSLISVTPFLMFIKSYRYAFGKSGKKPEITAKTENNNSD